MLKRALPLCACAMMLALPACEQDAGNEAAGNDASAQAGEAGNQTIAAGLDQNSRFLQAAKSVGLDATLAGPGPYTVFVPEDQAFADIDAANPARPESRAQLTGLVTNHILPGTVLAEDIGKAIDNANGKATLATMGGGTLTATREGGNIVLVDPAGGKATVTQADERFSNGVVHRINAVLRPRQGGEQGGGQQGGAQQGGAAGAGAGGQQPAG